MTDEDGCDDGDDDDDDDDGGDDDEDDDDGDDDNDGDDEYLSGSGTRMEDSGAFPKFFVPFSARSRTMIYIIVLIMVHN